MPDNLKLTYEEALSMYNFFAPHYGVTLKKDGDIITYNEMMEVLAGLNYGEWGNNIGWASLNKAGESLI